MSSSRRKSVDRSADFEQFIEQTSDYLPPSKTKANHPDLDKQLNKDNNKHSTKRKKKVYIGDLFDEPVAKEKTVNTTLQLPESLNNRLKEFCHQFGKSKNEVIRTLVEALLDEKGY